MRWCRLSSRCFPSAIMVNDRLAASAVLRFAELDARKRSKDHGSAYRREWTRRERQKNERSFMNRFSSLR